MKKQKLSVVVIALVICLIAGTIIGCGVNKDDANNETTHILEEEIAQLMERYLLHEMYTVYSSLNVDYSIKDESGMYFKVSNEDFDTWDEWTSFIESIFAGDALTNSTTNPQAYKNIDGYTYCSPGEMGWYISGDYTYEIIEQDAESALVQISRYEIEPGEDGNKRNELKWHFNLELTENGWRIHNTTIIDRSVDNNTSET